MAIFKRESIDVGRVEFAKPIGVNLGVPNAVGAVYNRTGFCGVCAR